jgi:hypothetical protein
MYRQVYTLIQSGRIKHCCIRGWAVQYGYIYTEYHSVCPLVGIGILPYSLASECAPSPGTKGGGGHTRLRLRSWGSPNFDDWRKGLALCLLSVLSSTI